MVNRDWLFTRDREGTENDADFSEWNNIKFYLRGWLCYFQVTIATWEYTCSFTSIPIKNNLNVLFLVENSHTFWYWKVTSIKALCSPFRWKPTTCMPENTPLGELWSMNHLPAQTSTSSSSYVNHSEQAQVIKGAISNGELTMRWYHLPSKEKIFQLR